MTFQVAIEFLDPKAMALPVTRFLGQFHIRHQIERLSVRRFVPDDHMDWTNIKPS